MQEQLERIEGLLRARKDTDPKARAAWLAVTEPGSNPDPLGRRMRQSRSIYNWPEGAVLGLLEDDICDTLNWEADYWLLAPGVWQARIMEGRGLLWHKAATRNEALAAALIAALEARAKNG